MSTRFTFYHLAGCLLLTPQFTGASEPTVQLAEIVVTAEAIRFAGKASPLRDGTVLHLDAQEISRFGLQDLGNLTKYDPSVSAPLDLSSGDGAFGYGGSGYAGFNIRGAEGNRIAIELDGVRQPPQYVSTSFDQGADGGSGGVGRDYFDPAVFSLVEILKSGNSTLFGSDALGGAVHLQTLSAADLLQDKALGGLLSGQYFSVNDSTAGQLAGATRQGDFEALLLYSGRDGHETINNGKIPPNPVDFSSTALLSKLGYRSGPHAFQLTAEHYQRDTFTEARSATTSPTTIFDRSVENREALTRKRLSLQWDYQPTVPRLFDQLENHVFYQSALSHSENASSANPVTIGGVSVPGRTRQQAIDFTTDLLGYSGLLHKKLSHRTFSQTLTSGLELSTEDSRNRFSRMDSGMPQETDRTSFAPATTTRSGLFLKNEIQPSAAWKISPGLRADFHHVDVSLDAAYLARLAALDGGTTVTPAQSYGNFSLSPDLAISYQATPATRIFANYSHNVRNPSAEELTMIFDHPPSGGNPVGSITVPNPRLAEESSDAFILGIGSETDHGKLDLSGFFTSYHDYIENSAPTGKKDDTGRDILTTINRGESEIFGFEAGGQWNLDSWKPWFAGSQLGLSTGKSVGISRTDDRWLNSIEPWKTVGWLGYQSPTDHFGLRLTGTYTTAVTHVDDTTNQGDFFRPPAWFTLDLTGHWKPTESATFSAGINNLLDQSYYRWSSVRRGGGHLGGNAVDDRSTAPGRHFFISLTHTF